MYKRKYSFAGFIAGILALILIAVGVLAVIPETRTKMADYVADKFSPAYAEIKDDNAKKDSQIKDLNKDIDSLNKTILEKDTSIAQKDKLIAEKDSLINTQTQQLNTCNANIQTLSSQKVTLLTAVSEIDNKINSTTDSVELEDLETRKTAILTQIDTLNTQISTLQTQKTQLEQDIATLQQEKATLQAEVSQLQNDKTNLQSQINSLLSQLEQYNLITVSIDGAYGVTSILINDTKMNADYELTNSAGTRSLTLMPYQKATIIFKDENLKATINGVRQESHVAVIEPAGQDVNVSAVDPTIPVTLAPGLYETGTTNLVSSWDDLVSCGKITINEYGLNVTDKTLTGDLICGEVTGLTSLGGAFSDCNKLTAIDVSRLDTKNVKTIGLMFSNCSSLITLDLRNFYTNNVTRMSGMFKGCSSLTTLDLSSFNTSSGPSMNLVFSGCSSLTTLDLSSFDFDLTDAFDNMFTDVLATCEIFVKNETAKTWVNTNFPDLTNVKIKTAV